MPTEMSLADQQKSGGQGSINRDGAISALSAREEILPEFSQWRKKFCSQEGVTTKNDKHFGTITAGCFVF